MPETTGTKIELVQAGGFIKYNFHCPRCGHDEWSKETYPTGTQRWRKCLHCGLDVRHSTTGGCTDMVAVVEDKFAAFTEQTYDFIERGLECWRNGGAGNA